jgi:hypothetical protein
VKGDLIHAADLGELRSNAQNIPLITIACVTPHQVQAQGGGTFQAKGPVMFRQKVEYVPDEISFNNREADISTKMYEEVEIEIGKDDEWSEVSGSYKRAMLRELKGKRENEEGEQNLEGVQQQLL